MKCLSTSGRVRARQFCRLASNPWASFSSLLLSKVLLDSLLRSKSRRFVPVGRTPILALRAVSSQRLRSETLAAARSAAAVGQRQFGSRPNRQAQSAFPDTEARKARRPCGLSCGLGVSDPSPQAPPRQARRISYFLNLKFYSIFFKKLRGRGAVRQRQFGSRPN